MTNKEISKTISYWLRHKPEEANLALDEFGWASIEGVLGTLKKEEAIFTVDQLIELNESFDKIRWHIDVDKGLIKATHGHSIPIILKENALKPPKLLYHGTSEEAFAHIKKEGIKSMSRRYVHLSETPDLAKEIGTRHGKPVVIEIETEALIANNFEFYKTEQNVWLCKDIPAIFLDTI